MLAGFGMTLVALCVGEVPPALPTESGSIVQQQASNAAMGCEPRAATYWGSAEYLFGWIKDAPMPVPLVTQGDPNDSLPGALGQPGTQVLFGQQPVDFGTFNGGRLSLGAWLDGCQHYGLEATGMLLEQRTPAFFVTTGSNVTEVYTLPIQTPEGVETSIFALVNNPGAPLPESTIQTFTGSQLWQGELNGLINQKRSAQGSLDTIIGFRHINLSESLDIRVDLSRSVGGGTSYTNGQDYFGTHSQFYGGQFGLRANRRYRLVTTTLTGKIGLGANDNSLNISGSRTQTNPGQPSTTTAGFVFSEPTNIGRQSHTNLAFAPELQARVGYDITQHVTAYVGYDFLYWSSVVRPGNQVDRVVNNTQRNGGALVGAARPEPFFDLSDFWFQSLSLGAQYSY